MNDLSLKLFSIIVGVFVIVLAYSLFEPSTASTIILFILAMVIPFRFIVRSTYKFHKEI